MLTPADLAIHPRDARFGREGTAPHWWMRGDPVATAFMNALSASFPQGERFFMDAVRRFRDMADGTLRAQIEAFTAQEAMHTREHIVFNRQIEAAGYDLTAIEEYHRRQFAWSRQQLAIGQLAATAALEHFTAILAHEILDDPRHMAGVDPALARLWRWHAMEEIEHKSVAFDTYMTAMKDEPAIARWWLRSQVMVIATVLFFREVVFSVRQFFKQDGIDNLKTWAKFLRYLFVDPGVMRRVMKSYFLYYLPGFHPWRVDDRALIAGVEAELANADAIA